jgi:hypothetical protein
MLINNDIIDCIINLHSFLEYDKLKLINKSFNKCIKNRIKRYIKANNIINKFVKYYKIDYWSNVRIDMMYTTNTLIRIYTRLYSDELVSKVYNWSFPKAQSTMDTKQIVLILKYIYENPILTRRIMIKYLKMFTRDQLLFIGI